MQRLSSCYFCGDAVDAAIEEYPLVSSDRFESLETDQRVVLCPSCRRKLTTVIERVLEAALGGRPTDGDPEELLAEMDDGEEMSVTKIESIDPPDQLGTSGEAADGTDASAGQPAESDPATNGADEDAEDGAEQEDQRDEPAPSIDSDGPAADGDVDNGAAGQQSEGEDTDEDPSDGTESAAAVVEAEVGYQKAEFNRVVRLLQNREFPVEIDELTVVAESAYGIDEETTHAIVDALIERGVVADNGDELVRA